MHRQPEDIAPLDTDERVAAYMNGVYMTSYAPCVITPGHPFERIATFDDTPFGVVAIIDTAQN